MKVLEGIMITLCLLTMGLGFLDYCMVDPQSAPQQTAVYVRLPRH